MTCLVLNAADAGYPARLRERLGTDAPPQLTALGNLDLLALPKTALFCSARCPGDAILRAYDTARGTRGLQPERDGRVRCSAWLGGM